MSTEVLNLIAGIVAGVLICLTLIVALLLEHEVPQDLISAFAARGVSRAAHAKLEAEIVNLEQRMNILEAKVAKKNE